MKYNQKANSLTPFFDCEVEIVAQSSDWMTVTKPAGMLVHPTKPEGEFTLWHWLIKKFPDEQLAPVNRLDRETSGLVLVARHTLAARELGKMMMERRIKKEYLAIVHGHVLQDHGIVEAPLDRQANHMPSKVYVKQAVVSNGYPARTEFWVLKRYLGFTLLRIQLHTGRLHQIRAHLSFIGHSVVGDKIYGLNEMFYLEFIKNGWTDQLQQKLFHSHHLLHAWQLTFQWEGTMWQCKSNPSVKMQQELHRLEAKFRKYKQSSVKVQKKFENLLTSTWA